MTLRTTQGLGSHINACQYYKGDPKPCVVLKVIVHFYDLHFIVLSYCALLLATLGIIVWIKVPSGLLLGLGWKKLPSVSCFILLFLFEFIICHRMPYVICEQ